MHYVSKLHEDTKSSMTIPFVFTNRRRENNAVSRGDRRFICACEEECQVDGNGRRRRGGGGGVVDLEWAESTFSFFFPLFFLNTCRRYRGSALSADWRPRPGVTCIQKRGRWRRSTIARGRFFAPLALPSSNIFLLDERVLDRKNRLLLLPLLRRRISRYICVSRSNGPLFSILPSE